MGKHGKKKKLSEFEIQKRKYEAQYLKGERAVYSNALKEKVQFSNRALTHLSLEKFRTTGEKIERLKLLGTARYIIKNSNFYQEHRFQAIYPSIAKHDCYIFEVMIDKRKIRVVVYEDKKLYILLSCFYVEKKDALGFDVE